MSMLTLSRARRAVACSAAAAASLLLTSIPAAAIEVDLKAPTVICGTGAPYLALEVQISSSVSGFGATAHATMCNATAIKTAIAMQAAGAGVTARPGPSGGPIFFAPFAVANGSHVSVSGYSAVSSATAQSVVVNVTGAGIGVGSEPINSCQIVYDRILDQPFILNGCNAAVTILN